ncbi:DUF6896 domain-containing protein [Corallococcus sicarius]|uniref:DUF6896 domain-containing protein n=1 Tax=Corallococcus sicarius TaxID=2316726 RepID=A0A3A8NSU5_9BACT|nr:hypothetical protein [Corallococcus sicarius]RKH45241.1 hypothetical protein D7X12_08405 [Corallococcus sicarius]
MQDSEWVVDLIEQYLGCVRAFSERLCRAMGQEDLLSGRRSKEIPRVGTTSDGLEFAFHGIGCRFSDGESSVDFDFTPDGKMSGFDAWRLHEFSRDNASSGGERSPEEVKEALKRLLNRGLIEPLPGSSLYRFRTRLRIVK